MNGQTIAPLNNELFKNFQGSELNALHSVVSSVRFDSDWNCKPSM